MILQRNKVKKIESRNPVHKVEMFVLQHLFSVRKLVEFVVVLEDAQNVEDLGYLILVMDIFVVLVVGMANVQLVVVVVSLAMF